MKDFIFILYLMNTLQLVKVVHKWPYQPKEGEENPKVAWTLT